MSSPPRDPVDLPKPASTQVTPPHPATRERRQVVEVVLDVGGHYWRRQVELEAVPAVGALLQLPECGWPATVAGTVCRLPGDAQQVPVVAVLARAPRGLPASATELRQAGWHLLL